MAERPLDLARDARHLSLGLLLSALLLLGALGLAGFRALAARPATPIEQARGALGDLERCISCHPRERAAAAHPQLFSSHATPSLGCTACHGGVGRALEATIAHAEAPDRASAPDPLLTRPGLEAACLRCHPPGVAGAEATARGALTFLRLGCAVCHPLSEDGRGGESFGPDLRGLGRRPKGELKTAILEPTAASPGASMPAFARSFGPEDPALDELLLFLAGLSLEGPARGSLHPVLRPRVEAPCTDCHAGANGAAGGRFEHACTYLLERAEGLRCAGCHGEAVPETAGPCPVVREHRSACVVCHEGVRAREARP